MNRSVLLIGKGGRECALAWKIFQSPRLGKLYIAPGNAGTARFGENVPIEPTDLPNLLAFALEKHIYLTIVGPDDPLAEGIVNLFKKHGLLIFGPTKSSAKVEWSKSYAKRLMKAVGIPTAQAFIRKTYESALRTVKEHFRRRALPLVLKADGLALGKGVTICHTLTEAETVLEEFMIKKVHGAAGNTILAEEFLEGQEISIHVLADGRTMKMFPSAQDHKPVFDGDEGPNTGGMGTIAPVPWFNSIADYQSVMSKVAKPLLDELKALGSRFAGCLFPGLKITKEGPKVLEFNVRFGDPETQVYMRLLKGDLLDILEACAGGWLSGVDMDWPPGFAANIVLASGGYPGNYKKGLRITGIEEAEKITGVVVFHAGTKLNPDGKLVTDGGRVLGVSAVGPTLKEALDLAYLGVSKIHFEGMHYRTDIGKKSLEM